MRVTPIAVVGIYLIARVGPDKLITGVIALQLLTIWLVSNTGCTIGEWLYDKPWKKKPTC